MKPIITIWIKESSLSQIYRGNYPSIWWRTNPDMQDVIAINVSYTWFIQMRDYEHDLKQNSDDVPF